MIIAGKVTFHIYVDPITSLVTSRVIYNTNIENTTYKICTGYCDSFNQLCGSNIQDCESLNEIGIYAQEENCFSYEE